MIIIYVYKFVEHINTPYHDRYIKIVEYLKQDNKLKKSYNKVWKDSVVSVDIRVSRMIISYYLIPDSATIKKLAPYMDSISLVNYKMTRDSTNILLPLYSTNYFSNTIAYIGIASPNVFCVGIDISSLRPKYTIFAPNFQNGMTEQFLEYYFYFDKNGNIDKVESYTAICP